MAASLAFLARYATQIMAVGVFLGLLVPPLAALARPLLTPTLFCDLTLSLLRTDMAATRSWVRRPGRLALVAIWLLLVCPFLAAALLWQLPLTDATRTAFILFAAAPPITVIPAYALLLGANLSLAAIVLTLASFAAPVTVPAVAILILRLPIDIGVADLFWRLLLLIGGSVLAAAVLRRLLGVTRIHGWALRLNGLIVIAMLVLALAIMDGVTAQLLVTPVRVLGFAAGTIFANVGLQVVTVAVFWWLGRAEALTLGLAAGYRNSILLLAVLGSAASPEIGLLAAAAQIPVYILPALQRPVFRAIGLRPG